SRSAYNAYNPARYLMADSALSATSPVSRLRPAHSCSSAARRTASRPRRLTQGEYGGCAVTCPDREVHLLRRGIKLFCPFSILSDRSVAARQAWDLSIFLILPDG